MLIILRPVLLENAMQRTYSQFMRSYHSKGAVGEVSRPVYRSVYEKGLRNSDIYSYQLSEKKGGCRMPAGKTILFFVSLAP